MKDRLISPTHLQPLRGSNPPSPDQIRRTLSQLNLKTHEEKLKELDKVVAPLQESLRGGTNPLLLHPSVRFGEVNHLSNDIINQHSEKLRTAVSNHKAGSERLRSAATSIAPEHRTRPSAAAPSLAGILDEVMTAAPPSRELTDSQRSFLVSNPEKYSRMERMVRLIHMFITQNWYWLRFLLIGTGVVLALLLLAPLIAI